MKTQQGNNKKALVLFSGQLDSIKTLYNFSIGYPSYHVDLLYIKNIGFRNDEIIPIEAAKKVKKIFNNIDGFYVVDGKEVQLKLIQYISKKLERTAIVEDCCVICQFGIQLIYALMCNNREIIKKTRVLGENFEKIIEIPFQFKRSLIIKNNHDLPLNTILDFKDLLPTSKCQLSYFHNYKFKGEINFDHLKDIFESFVKENIGSNLKNLLKLEKLI